jgi:hypothetical protein
MTLKLRFGLFAALEKGQLGWMVQRVCDGNGNGYVRSKSTHTQYNGSHAPAHGYMYSGRRIDMFSMALD